MHKRRLCIGMAVCILVLLFNCGAPGGGQSKSDPRPDIPQESEEFLVSVDLDNAKIEISEPLVPVQTGLINGHTIDVRNGPAGCAWDAVNYVLTCEILFRNLDSDECMLNVRTRFSSSTNPTAIMAQADYGWMVPGVSYNLVPDTAQPINNSGYCITDDFPSSAGSEEGCANTWQAGIPSGGAVATQKFIFTNVPSGTYQFNLQVFADYQACSAPAGMKIIPAGCFDIGDAFNEGQGDELPVHQACVTTDYYMDQHEVTNAEYAACVSAASCSPPDFMSSYTRATYYGNATYDNFPVVYVNWNKAAAFCAWRGQRLPTEAEWELAARAGGPGRRYPNGNTITGSDANYYASGDPFNDDTSPVEYYPANDFGLYDMAGNVWEWNSDYYGADYYLSSPVDDPAGPDTGASRVVRGGSFGNGTTTMRVSERANFSEDTRGSLIGFRCVETR